MIEALSSFSSLQHKLLVTKSPFTLFKRQWMLLTTLVRLSTIKGNMDIISTDKLLLHSTLAIKINNGRGHGGNQPN